MHAEEEDSVSEVSDGNGSDAAVEDDSPIQLRGQREFSIPGILDESQLHFSRSTTRNDFLKSRSRLET